MRVKLNLLFLAVAAVSSIGAQAVWVIPALQTKEANLFSRLEDRALVAVVAAIDNVNFNDVALTQKIGRRLISLGDILGGSIYDSEGTRVGQFGKMPALSWISARREGVARLRDPSLCCIDVLLTPQQTGLQNDLILRLDATRAQNHIRSHFGDLALKSSINALICCISVVVLLYFLVSRPIARMKWAAENAAANPQKATNFELNWNRRDELGSLSQSITKLAKKTASVYQNELFVAKQVMYRTRMAIIHFNSQGRAIAVNRPALRLFQAKNLKELQQANPKMFRYAKMFEGDPVDAIESLSRGSFSEAGSAITKNSEIPCMISGAIMHKANGEILRYAITIVPALDYANQINTLKTEIADREIETAARKRQWAEMRLVSETYNDILEQEHGTPKELLKNEAVSIKSAVEQWRAYVTDLGLSIDVQFPDQKISVKTDRNKLYDVFKDIMSCLFLRSQFESPIFSIKVERTGENRLEISIVDTSLQECRNYLPEDEERSHWKHLLPLISAKLGSLDGEVIDANHRQGSPNEFVFGLPIIAPETATKDEPHSNDSAAA